MAYRHPSAEKPVNIINEMTVMILIGVKKNVSKIENVQKTAVVAYYDDSYIMAHQC
jgi:hypothetical protein